MSAYSDQLVVATWNAIRKKKKSLGPSLDSVEKRDGLAMSAVDAE